MDKFPKYYIISYVIQTQGNNFFNDCTLMSDKPLNRKELGKILLELNIKRYPNIKITINMIFEITEEEYKIWNQ